GKRVAHAIQHFADIVAGFAEVSALRETQTDLAYAFARTRGNPLEVRHYRQSILERLRNEQLHFFRAHVRITNLHRKLGDFDLGQQIDRKVTEAHQAHHDDDEEGHRGGDGAVNGASDYGHERVPGVAVLGLGSALASGLFTILADDLQHVFRLESLQL